MAADRGDELPGQPRLPAGGLSLFARPGVFHRPRHEGDRIRAPGVVVPTKPFWGVIGVAPPPSMGRVPSARPTSSAATWTTMTCSPEPACSCRSTPAALISIGDGHAVQGNGEVGMSAVETSLKGEIQVVLHKGMRTNWPRAETPTHYMSMGLHEDLNQAAKIATRRDAQFHCRDQGPAARRRLHAAQRRHGPARDRDRRRHQRASTPCCRRRSSKSRAYSILMWALVTTSLHFLISELRFAA